MILFSEELEHDRLEVKYLVGEFSESKDTKEMVSYENSGELNVSYSSHYSKQRVSFVDIFCAFCGAITLHIYPNPIYYRDGGWMPVIKMLQLKMTLDLFSAHP